MKCLMYVSESTSESTERVPPDLTAILQRSRSRNKKNDLTGLLAYKQRRYLQVIEGDEMLVDSLFAKIKLDPRHKRIQLILDISVQSRSFESWPLKLVPVLNDELQVMRFLSRHRASLEKIPPVKLELLNFFFGQPVIAGKNTGQGKNEYARTDLMLDDWPTFSKLVPSDQLITVCAELVRGAVSYQDLLDNTQGVTETQLISELKRLDELGLLVRMPSRLPVQGHQPSIYTKLRTFLSKHD